MKAFRGALALLVLSVAAVSAEHIACSSVGSDLASFVAPGSHGCVDQDRTYSNFSYDSLESGTAAGDVQVEIDTVLLPGDDQHTVDFQSAGWASRFLIGFDIAVLSSYPDVSIGAVDFDIFQDMRAEVPEPATLMPPAVAFLALGLYRRRHS